LAKKQAKVDDIEGGEPTTPSGEEDKFEASTPCLKARLQSRENFDGSYYTFWTSCQTAKAFEQ